MSDIDFNDEEIDFNWRPESYGDDEELFPAYPLHPGVMLKDEVLPAYRLTGVALAEAMARPRPTVSKLLNGKATMTADLAVRIELAIGYDALVLLKMQAAVDLAKVLREKAGKLANVKPVRMAA